MKKTADNNSGRNAPIMITQYGSAARRLCPHCHRYVFSIREIADAALPDPTLSAWLERSTWKTILRCKKCDGTSYASLTSTLLMWFTAIAALVATLALFSLFSGFNALVVFLIGSFIAALAYVYAIQLFIKVQPTDPYERFDMLESAELSVSLQTLSAVLQRITTGRFVLLFGPGESQWLWLVRKDQDYCIQLALYPKHLEALKTPFEHAARKAKIHVEEKFEDQQQVLSCRLGSDPQTAGELAWAIFTDTMGLKKDALVSMKWL